MNLRYVEEIESSEPEPPEEVQTCGRRWCSKRYSVAILTFLGMVNLFILRSNVNVAVVEMTSQQPLLLRNGTYVHKTEFDWSTQMKSLVYGAFSIGYCLSPIGGRIASIFGGATIFGLGIAATAMVTFLTPFLVHINFFLFIGSRILEGILEAFSKVSFFEIWARWAPEEERSRLVAISFTGLYFGTMVSFSISGIISSVWGWRTIFYVTGGTAIFWWLFWFILVHDDPSRDPCISIEERLYIIKHVNHKPRKKENYPMKQILLSKPVWAVCIAEFTFGFGYSHTYLWLPTFIKDIEHLSVTSIGFISAIPPLCATVAHPIAGVFGDFLRNNGPLSVTQVHKLFISGGFLIAAVCFFISGFLMKFTPAVICFSIFRFFTSFSEVAMHVVLLDISPSHASFISGVSTLCGTLATILSPILTGYIVNEHSLAQWSIWLIIIGLIYVIGAVLFLALGSGNMQPWACTSDDAFSTELPSILSSERSTDSE